VVEGLFGHEDNVGGPFGPLPAGSVQRMTLGAGAWHSERNASKTEGMRFIQIWILPDTPSLPPGVEQRVFTKDDRSNRLLRAFAPMAEIDGSDPTPVGVHQDASVYIGSLDSGVEVRHEIGTDRGAYLYVIAGRVMLGGGSGAGDELATSDALATGDAAKVTDEPGLAIRAEEPSELILVDVPMQFDPVGIWAGRT
jgi:redox-sensitive bicupin YhaK (pirin superfamily)